MASADEPSPHSLTEQLTEAVDCFETFSNLGNESGDRSEFFRGVELVKAALRRLRGLDRLALFEHPADPDARLDGDGCTWYPWTAGDDLLERRACDGCGANCNDGWLTDEDFDDETGERLVRCMDCLDLIDEPLWGEGNEDTDDC